MGRCPLFPPALNVADWPRERGQRTAEMHVTGRPLTRRPQPPAVLSTRHLQPEALLAHLVSTCVCQEQRPLTHQLPEVGAPSTGVGELTKPL